MHLLQNVRQPRFEQALKIVSDRHASFRPIKWDDSSGRNSSSTIDGRSSGSARAQDFFPLALAAHLLGREAENASLLARARQACDEIFDIRRAGMDRSFG
jgi:hypothetical protein